MQFFFMFQLMILKEQNNQKRTQADGMPDVNHDQESTPSTNGKVGTKLFILGPLHLLVSVKSLVLLLDMCTEVHIQDHPVNCQNKVITYYIYNICLNASLTYLYFHPRVRGF